jgi:Zn-dependent peptidase ImmA (M78 family)
VARRDEILAAVYEAQRLHNEFDSKARVAAGEGRIDVFGMLVTRDIPVIFRPLQTLLGAYINDPDKGIIVTSQRSLPIQRFTAAHEFGHEELGHETSLDPEDILTRALFVTEKSYDSQEIQANAFASQLLTPSWLIAQHMTRQGWTPNHMANPVTVYQLSLRMGSSYSATCYALADSGTINGETRRKLLAVQRKAIKRQLVKPYEPENWYGDVWLVTDRDNGLVLEGSRSDMVVLKLAEHASSGYLWQLGDLVDAGLAIKEDGRSGPDEQYIGGLIFRTVIAEPRHETGARGHVQLREVRPWQSTGDPLQSVDLDIELLGPTPAGLLLEQREALLGVA